MRGLMDEDVDLGLDYSHILWLCLLCFVAKESKELDAVLVGLQAHLLALGVGDDVGLQQLIRVVRVLVFLFSLNFNKIVALVFNHLI